MGVAFQAKTYKEKRVFRLGITGLPGAGKTSLACRLAPKISKDPTQGIALIQGDTILPQNIIPVCKVIDRFVVEHICLSQICAKSEVVILDAIVFLDISPEECQTRCSQRKNHAVDIVSFEDLIDEIQFGLDKLILSHNLLFCRVNRTQLEFILKFDLMGAELMNFMFPNTRLVEAYL